MGPFTYKVFNLYSFIRCGTYNSHLYTTLPLKCESIYSACSPFKRKLLLACIVVAGFSINGPTLLVPLLLLSAQMDRLPQSYPSSNRDSDTTFRSRGEPGEPPTSRPEQPHKQERHHTPL